MSLEDDLLEQRVKRTAEIEALGFRAYGQRFDFTHTVPQILATESAKIVRTAEVAGVFTLPVPAAEDPGSNAMPLTLGIATPVIAHSSRAAPAASMRCAESLASMPETSASIASVMSPRVSASGGGASLAIANITAIALSPG